MSARTKKLVIIAMLCAIAYVVMVVGRVPIVLFLKYDPKDVIITIGGFMMGPLAAFAISVVVSLIEMVTVSDTGPVGLVMNMISTCAFACTASIIYKKKHKISGAVIGLAFGVIAMTAIMLLWNYLITPIYLKIPRETVASMLVPVFLPFNLVKAGLNMALTILLYKPVVAAVRKARFLTSSGESKGGRINIGLLLVAILLFCTCVLLFLVLAGKI